MQAPMGGVMRRSAFVIALCLVAFGARVGVGVTLLSRGEAEFVLASDDGDAYDAAARWQAFGTPIAVTDRIAGKWDVSGVSVMERWPRGYWLFLAGQYRLFGSAYASTVVLQALLGAAGVFAALALARRVVRSEIVARIVAVSVALSATGVYLSAALYAEAVYIPLILAALALLAARSTALAFAAGVAFGAAELTRPLALPIFAVALAWSSARGWRSAACVCAGFAIPIVPSLDSTVFTAGGREALLGHYSLATDAVAGAVTLFITGGWAPIGEPPLPASAALRIAEWVLVAGGAIWLMRGHRTAELWLIFGAIAAIVVPPLAVGLPLVRYRAPADPLFIIFIAAAAQAAWTTRRWRVPFPRWSASPSPS